MLVRTLPLALLAVSAIAFPQVRPTPTTLLLHLDGNADGLRVTQVHPKAVPFVAPRSAGTPAARIRLLDANGIELARVAVDLGMFNLDRGRNRGERIMIGDEVREPRVSLLVKVPDVRARIGRLLIEQRVASETRVLGVVDGATIRRLAKVTSDPLDNPVVKTHLKTGPVENRYDIVVIGDGYQASEQARFYADITNWMNYLFVREPFKTYRGFFNVHSVFRASKDSGADHPDRSPPIVKDTVYDASYNTGNTPRCLYIKNQSQAHRDAALAPDVEGRVVVFVNDRRYGGCAGTFAVSYNGTTGSYVQTHEFGHSFGGLADEYGGNNTPYNGPEPGQPNVTADRNCSKWALWKGINGVGCNEGGRYHNRGIWRPKVNCLMRNIAEWCEVCVEELTKRGYATVHPIENPVPAASAFTVARPASVAVRFDNLVPNGQIRWYVNNALAQSGGTTFQFKTAGLRAGVHRLVVQVTDPTALVRKDPTKALVNTRVWSVSVTDPGLADLAITALTAPAAADAGTTIAIETAVTNRGGGAATSFRVENFLSTDQTITTADTFLGHATVASLARNAVVRVKRSVSLPFFLDRGTYWLASWVDRRDEVEENDDTNNIAMRALRGGGVTGCPTQLEFRMPLTWPVSEHTHSLAAGGTTVMALTAPCRVNEWYLVLWGCSGSTPGTRFPPLTLPLNIDACTSLALAASSGPFFGFFGRVSFGRRAVPVAALPKGLSIRPFTGHFATLFFSSDLSRVSGVSNAVRETYSR